MIGFPRKDKSRTSHAATRAVLIPNSLGVTVKKSNKYSHISLSSK